jgi:hypothetical protein
MFFDVVRRYAMRVKIGRRAGLTGERLARMIAAAGHWL